MNRRRLTRSLAFGGIIGGVSTSRAAAHSAEQGFILLLPTDIYIAAGTLAVVASIVLMTILSRYVSRDFMRAKSVPIGSAKSISIVSLIATAMLFVLIWIGTTGPRDPLGNLLPLTIWTLWWIGFVALLPIFGNIWSHLNPWSGIYRMLAMRADPPFTLHKRLGVWPGVAIFLLFHSFAIADIAPSDPNRLAMIVGGYWAVTLIGMLAFGGKAWLTQAECFTIPFHLLASLAPLQNGKIGWPGWASFHIDRLDLSHAAFCIVMLGAGSFDGLHETFWWLGQIGINPLEFPGRSAVIWTSTFGMIATCATLGAAFTLSIWIGLRLVSGPHVTLEKALPLFALSLIPIAYGYHVAHYLTSFLVGIQYSLIALTDPWATGANLLGLPKLQVTTGFLSDPASVRVIWLTQATVVVISHILAVIMADAAATKLFETRRDIVLSQSALSVLMVAYTVFGLWLLASPRGV